MRIGGRVVNDLPPKDRDIAMVFQNYALYPHMTAYDNMAFGAEDARGRRSRRSTAASTSAARVLGLADVLRKRPRTLSGGQRQRVAMGRAIVREPQAFLMDEPLSNLDAKLRVEMRAEIARIQRDLGVTTIYVTHDQTEAMTLGDRVAVMRDGVLQQVDAPQDALRPAGEPAGWRRRSAARAAGPPPSSASSRRRRSSAGGGVPGGDRLAVAGADQLGGLAQAPRRRASTASATASRLLAKMSAQIAGLEPATRVVSRKLGPTSGMPLGVAAQLGRRLGRRARWRRTCGRWLTVAISRSWASASIACGRAPSPATARCRRS